MMSATGTPVIAVVSGTITFAEYDESGGNILFLSGDDGNTYYYMHQNENFVTSGRVTAGQKLGTVGSTGNADSPHLHFEYHPGGGDSVNPYSLVSSLC